MSKRAATRLVELVETHNIALALKRAQDEGSGYDHSRWKRALYHAIALSGVTGSGMLEKIRIALELP